MVSKIERDRYADTGFAVADTSANLDAHLFRQIMRKTGAERLAIGCQMADTARQLVWAGIPAGLPVSEQRALFFERFYGSTLALSCNAASRSHGDAGK